MDLSPKVWFVLFLSAAIFDTLLLIWAFVNQSWILVFLFIITAMGGGYWLLTRWNIDERTDTALDDAARTTVTVFSTSTIASGIVAIIYAFLTDLSTAFYPIGATLIICGVVLFYLQAILSVKREGEMR